jgi:hypothetical protein
MKKAILEITMQVSPANRSHAGAVYAKYRAPFLANVPGAESKELLLRDEDVQVIHGFESRDLAEKYLASTLFGVDVVEELKPYLAAAPDIRVYERQ